MSHSYQLVQFSFQIAATVIHNSFFFRIWKFNLFKTFILLRLALPNRKHERKIAFQDQQNDLVQFRHNLGVETQILTERTVRIKIIIKIHLTPIYRTSASGQVNSL